MQDTLADMCTRIRNGQMAGKTAVSMPSSKTKVALARVLADEGFVGGYNVQEDGVKATLSVELRYHEGLPVIREIKRSSRPGLRRYAGKDTLPKVQGGLGVAIVSTSKGLMTDSDARKAGIGGEVLCTVF
jgi:small subunit ribosomal protein S8